MAEITEKFEAIRAALASEQNTEAAQILEDVKQKFSQLRPAHRSEFYLLEGTLYKQEGQWDLAHEAFNQLYSAGFRRDEPYNQTQALQEIGELYCLQGKIAESLASYRKALRVLNSHMEGYHSKLSRNYLGQGQCFLQAQDPDTAIMYYQLAKTYASSDKNLALEAQAFLALAEAYGQLGKTRENLRYTRSALTAFKQAGLDHEAQAAECKLQNSEE